MIMKKNKVLLLIYSILMIGVGITFIFNGIFYLYEYFANIGTEIAYLIIPMTVGLIEICLGGASLLNGVKVLQTEVLIKEEENDENTVSIVQYIVKRKHGQFFQLHILCICTPILFLLERFQSFLVANGNIYIVIPLFAGFFVPFIGITIAQNLKQKKKIGVVKYQLLTELFYGIAGMYCLVVNIIFYFDIPTLVAVSILLALELCVFANTIMHLSKKALKEDVETSLDNKIRNITDIDTRFIKDEKDNDDYSI